MRIRYRITRRERLNDGTGKSLWGNIHTGQDLEVNQKMLESFRTQYGSDEVRLEMDIMIVIAGPRR